MQLYIHIYKMYKRGEIKKDTLIMDIQAVMEVMEDLADMEDTEFQEYLEVMLEIQAVINAEEQDLSIMERNVNAWKRRSMERNIKRRRDLVARLVHLAQAPLHLLVISWWILKQIYFFLFTNLLICIKVLSVLLFILFSFCYDFQPNR